MTRICWWLVHAISRMLDTGERDAVLGDFAESGETGGQALRDVLGLVVRRQAALWKDWRPWLALIGLVGPVGLSLIVFSAVFSGTWELYRWIVSNYKYIEPALLDQTGFTLRHGILLSVCSLLLLLSWSWTGGFVLGSLSRRTIWAHGVVFCLVWWHFSGALRGALAPKLSTALFLPPLIWGVRQGLRLDTLRLRPAIFLAVGTAIVTVLAIWTEGWWRAGGWPRTMLFLSLILNWPVGYMVAIATLSRRKILAH
jgi:hypothetical protein